ncbi:MAG: hypothetical protein UW41_C0022G0014 [Candidatus Collierbacteria bacterium GW2011_GWC2_44_18]|uniref:Glycosyltransferase RgtA/B/C/D-like domain-containing protein n=2 Tax=Microgenomates group TaxID=1794810 RepID=A0A0G1LGB3_9BACT|nr:MAG: hypothetical protein UW16_C0030G0013 [Microgenomates group bacterium GW2011_GWC1_44_10]KKT48651.1 MAG: hypothetical protein UW41_C0022G0014 [Candidatus Collierbacteria bacterium GW2011_GWC2_44_18]KKT67727.1 MAG: hypothetical protein UW60_C0001G0005 [Candidatus Woesebacteria bacterium GW2011_GWA2_44_33]
MKYIYLCLFLFAVLIFLIHYAISGQAVYGDGIGYYSHLHSWIIDRDWDYTNEYKHIYDHEHNNFDTGVESPVVQIVSTSESGKAENFYGTGVAVLLLPFYLLAHLISMALNLFGANLTTNGYGDWYQIFSGLGAIFYTVCGIYFLEKIIYFETRNSRISVVSAMTIFLSTNLLYYGSFDVINSHFASFFLATVFFYLFFNDKGSNNHLLLGLMAGLMTITRIQDSVIVILWVTEILRSHNLKLKVVSKFLIGFLFGIMPLAIHWSMVFDNPLRQTYIRGLFETFQARQVPSILGSLFNPVTGLFTRIPLLAVLYIFFLYLVVKKEAKNLLYPFSFLVMQFCIITVQGGWVAAAYGGRMYLSSMVFFGLLLGKLLLRISVKSLARVYLIVSLFIVINFISISLFILRDKGAEGGEHGTEQRTLQRIQKFLN